MLNFLFLIVATCLGILNYFDIAIIIAFIMFVVNEEIYWYNTKDEIEVWL